MPDRTSAPSQGMLPHRALVAVGGGAYHLVEHRRAREGEWLCVQIVGSEWPLLTLGVHQGERIVCATRSYGADEIIVQGVVIDTVQVVETATSPQQ